MSGDDIINYLKQNGESDANEIIANLGISRSSFSDAIGGILRWDKATNQTTILRRSVGRKYKYRV